MLQCQLEFPQHSFIAVTNCVCSLFLPVQIFGNRWKRFGCQWSYSKCTSGSVPNISQLASVTALCLRFWCKLHALLDELGRRKEREREQRNFRGLFLDWSCKFEPCRGIFKSMKLCLTTSSGETFVHVAGLFVI